MRLLVIEEQQSIATSQLRSERLILLSTATTADTLSMLRHNTFDLVLLNLASLGDDGFDLILQIRAAGNNTPVIALTGDLAEDRTRALSLGADDAIVQSVDPGELRARILAVSQCSTSRPQPTLTLGDLSVCTETREARFANRPIQLTPMESAMLELLLLRKGTVITKQAFLHHLYNGLDEPETKIIDVFICKLRRRLNQAGLTDIISTVWGQGYTIYETSHSGRSARLNIAMRHFDPMVA